MSVCNVEVRKHKTDKTVLLLAACRLCMQTAGLYRVTQEQLYASRLVKDQIRIFPYNKR